MFTFIKSAWRWLRLSEPKHVAERIWLLVNDLIESCVWLHFRHFIFPYYTIETQLGCLTCNKGRVPYLRMSRIGLYVSAFRRCIGRQDCLSEKQLVYSGPWGQNSLLDRSILVEICSQIRVIQQKWLRYTNVNCLDLLFNIHISINVWKCLQTKI